MKRIFYTPHLKFRLLFREIPYALPKQIYQSSNEHYLDTKTFSKIAVKKVKFKDAIREMATIYEVTNGEIKIITIHPLKVGQKINRLNSGRWQKL